MIRFLHCADIHLDSRRNEMRAAFTSMILYVQMNKIDFLLISGDLFENDCLSRDTATLICHEFERIPECKVIIAPGDRDYHTSKSFYAYAAFPNNVCIFHSSELSYFDFPDKNTTVYGYAFTSPTLTACPFAGLPPRNKNRLNILLAHGELGTTESESCPIPMSAVTNTGYDYIALGHNHTATDVRLAGKTYYAYSGCLEGRGFDECGEKGAVVGAMDKQEQKLSFAAKFIRFAKRCYYTEILDVTAAASNADIAARLNDCMREKHYTNDTALRVVFTGRLDASVRISPSYIKSQFPRQYILDIQDDTLPTLHEDVLQNDMTVRGFFYRSLSDRLHSNNPSERKSAADALRYGLAALSGTDILDT